MAELHSEDLLELSLEDIKASCGLGLDIGKHSFILDKVRSGNQGNYVNKRASSFAVLPWTHMVMHKKVFPLPSPGSGTLYITS